MLFNEAEDDLHNKLFCRRVSSNVLIEIGVYRVLYGYRVRAGFVGALSCSLDWCAGANWSQVESLYTMCLAVLSSREEDRNCFDGIPPHSIVKPYFNDPEFLKDVALLIPPDATGVVRLDSSPIVADHSVLWV